VTKCLQSRSGGSEISRMKRLLIVDDQADLRRLMRWSLEVLETPVELHEAAGSEAGLAMAMSLRPDLVLLDVMLPGGIDGLEVCRRIRAEESLQATRVVLVSAKGQACDVRAGLDAGAHAYIVKPFSPQRLLETVEKLLQSAPSPA